MRSAAVPYAAPRDVNGGVRHSLGGAYAGEVASAVYEHTRLEQVLRSIQRSLQHHARLNLRRTHPTTYQLLLTVPDVYR